MALAANALCTVAEVKAFVHITDANQDSYIEALVNRASNAIEVYCDNYFINRSNLVETYDGDGERELMLDHYPIVAVTHVKETSGGVVTTINASYYLIYGDEGIIRMHPDYGYIFTKGFRNFEVKYDAGRGADLANIPLDVTQACVKLAAVWYEGNSADFTTTFEEGVIREAPATAIPPTVRSLLSPYKKRHVG